MICRDNNSVCTHPCINNALLNWGVRRHDPEVLRTCHQIADNAKSTPPTSQQYHQN